jgi:tetratricopeptide (TPR) repeat protein
MFLPLARFMSMLQLINEDLNNCDVFVMVLWGRWGTPPRSGKFTSGTEEEYHISLERAEKTMSPHMLLYFRSVPQAQRADPGDELKKVNAFRTKIEVEKKIFYKAYEEPQQWEELLLEHLAKWLDKKKIGPEFAVTEDRVSASQDAAALADELKKMKAEMKALKREIEKRDEAHGTRINQRRKAAIDYAVKAVKLLGEGKLTLAEENFAKSVEQYAEPEVLNNYGLFLYQIGSLDRARKKFEKVIDLPTNPANDPHRARAYKLLGNVYLTWGNFSEAEQMFERAISLAKNLNDKKAEVDYLGSLGNVYIERGNVSKAGKIYASTLKISAGLDDEDGMRKAYGSLGNVYVERGELKKAEAAFEKSRQLSTKLDHKEGMENAYLGLGIVYERQGHRVKAEKAYEQALKLAKLLGHKAGMERAYGNLGNLYAGCKDLKKAQEMFEETLGLAKALGHKEGMANTFDNLGSLYRTLGKTKKAKEMLAQSVELYKGIGNKVEAKKVQAKINALNKETSSRKATSAKGRPYRPSTGGRPYRAASASRPYRPHASKKK